MSTSAAELEKVKAALAQLQAQPYLLGPMLLAGRILLRMGRNDTAQKLSHRYAERFGVPPVAGEALLALAHAAPVRTYEEGKAIIREGDHSDSLFVVLDGQVEVHRSGIGPLAMLQSGHSFGEVALLAGISRTASVFARGRVSVMRVTQSHIAQVSQHFPPLERILRAVYRDRVLAQLIPNNSFLASLTRTQRHDIFNRFRPCTVPKGTAVLTEGREAAGFFIIVSGTARVWRRTLHGERETLADLGPGDFFGEISLLFEVPVTATVEARDQLNYYALGRGDFHAVMKSYPAQTEALMKIARERMGFATDIEPLDVGLWNAGVDVDEAVTRVQSPGYRQLPGQITCPQCGFDQAYSPVCVTCCAPIAEAQADLQRRLSSTADTVTIDWNTDQNIDK